jgi:hypothetical protein
MNIPSNQAISSIPDYYNTKKNAGEIENYEYTSGHYTLREFATSDIIKLDFKSPVPTRAAVSSMLQNINSDFKIQLSNHNKESNSHSDKFDKL